MKKYIFSLLLICAAVQQVGATTEGGFDHGNGGDMCENRIYTIRDDLESWILQGGSKGLTLPENLSHEDYDRGMLVQMKLAKVSCIEEKIFVGKAEKTCKNYETSDGEMFIVCNVTRFMNTSESDQYVLVHHEYAGLAGLETNTQESSNYEISNQITAYLEDQIVKKLVVRPKKPQEPWNCKENPFPGCSSEFPPEDIPLPW